MIFVDKEEVVKIPAYITCRIHGREQLDLFTIRERRENMRQHTALDLSCSAQLLYDPLLLFYHVFPFHPIPLHAADRIHLTVQSKAGPVNLLMHDFKFTDGERLGRNGFQLPFPHADNSVQQRVELTHELFEPQLIECQRNQEDHRSCDSYHTSDTSYHLLIVLHGNFSDNCPVGRVHRHGKCADRVSVFIFEDFSAVALTD